MTLHRTLQKKLVAEKLKELESKGVKGNVSSIEAASHELWKRALLKPSSNYTSNSSKEVA
ncbi:hypothetical protein CR513_09492, partial [Mucuna pruriens]